MSHRKDALLLDEILHADDGRLEARLVVRPGTSFSDSFGNLPAWVGPEVMAQAISALSGWRSLRARGHLPAIGLLLGIRSYAAPAGDFLCGETLDVEVIESSEDEEGMAVFDGKNPPFGRGSGDRDTDGLPASGRHVSREGVRPR